MVFPAMCTSAPTRAPSMAKRLCLSDHSTTSSRRDHDRLNIDALVESLFSVSDLIDASFDGIVESRSTDSDDDFFQRALHVGSVIVEASKRSARKCSSLHNASVWPLLPDLTIKVFSMLDTQSLLCAAATSSFFHKCAMDPLCYTNIDLGNKKPNIKDPKNKDAMVSTIIQRAGSAIQSIKLGDFPPYIIDDDDDKWGYKQRKESPFLTASCLRSLSANGGAPGSCLRSLHLYHIEMKYKTGWEECQAATSAALSAALSVCPSLVELKMVYMPHVNINRILESMSRYCHLLEHFIYELDEGSSDPVEASVCKEFVLNCPKITTLTLQACKVHDSVAFKLVKGFHKLKYLDFKNVRNITGSFLNNLGTKGGANSLEVMILSGCYRLDKVEVEKFMKALLAGNCRHLRHLDISESGDLVRNGARYRYALSSIIPSKKLLEQRPNFCLAIEIY